MAREETKPFRQQESTSERECLEVPKSIRKPQETEDRVEMAFFKAGDLTFDSKVFRICIECRLFAKVERISWSVCSFLEREGFF